MPFTFVASDTCLAELQYCQDGGCLGTKESFRHL